MFVVALSGVFDVRAATRYRLQYERWHRYEPPFITLCVPWGGPTGFNVVAVRERPDGTSRCTIPRHCP